MKRLLLLGFAGIVGCGDSEPDEVLAVDAALDAVAVDSSTDAPVDAPVDAATTARVQATVSYAGSAQGALILASFPSRPPMGPPAGFAQQATPTWPASLALENLQPTAPPTCWPCSTCRRRRRPSPDRKTARRGARRSR